MGLRCRKVQCCYVTLVVSISTLSVFLPYSYLSSKPQEEKAGPDFDEILGNSRDNDHATLFNDHICTDSNCKNITARARFRKALSNVVESENIIRVYKHGIEKKGVYAFYQETPVKGISRKSVFESETYSIPLQKSCAVVGNGGILRNSHCGPQINTKDFVFRFNVADIKHHRADVGFKTNITVINKLLCLRAHDSMKLGKKNFFPGEVTKKDAISRMRYLNQSIMLYMESMDDVRCTRTMLQYVMERFQNKLHLKFRVGYTPYGNLSNLTKSFLRLRGLPTVGIRTALAALLLCDDVTLYGFYPFPRDSNGNMIPHHYYGAWSHKVNKYDKSVHGWDEEFATLQSLHKNGVLRLVTSPCV